MKLAFDQIDGARPERTIAGHSFGGKVALETARIGELSALNHLVVIDSMPGSRELIHSSDSAFAIINTIASLSNTFASITDFVASLRSAGLSRTVSQWLAGSLERTGDHLRFALDPAEIRALALDYSVRDLWPLIESPPGELQIHLVIGDQSDTFNEADRARARRSSALNPRVTVDLLPAGHWVPLDDPDGLLRVMDLRIGSTGGEK